MPVLNSSIPDSSDVVVTDQRVRPMSGRKSYFNGLDFYLIAQLAEAALSGLHSVSAPGTNSNILNDYRFILIRNLSEQSV